MRMKKPILSWRASISPYLEFPPIDLSLAWDSEEQQNSKAAIEEDNLFDFDEFKDQGEKWETNFVAISGKGTIWDDSKQMSYKDFRKGASNTIILIEIPNLGIHWMEPWDLSVDDFIHLRSKLYDPEKRYCVGYADGRVIDMDYGQLMRLEREVFFGAGWGGVS